MKIAFVSDLHSDITPANGRLLAHLSEAVERSGPDVFGLVGDLANDLRGWGATLGAFQSLPCEKLVVPGNHDVWVESKSAVRRSHDSWWKYTVSLRDMAEARGFRYLPGRPHVLDQTVFVGSLGWYDYSLRDPRLERFYSAHDYDRGVFLDSRHRTHSWNDVDNAVWLRNPEASDWRERRARLSTGAVFERVFDLLRSDLRSVLPRASRLVCLVHTNPFAECLERKDEPDPFDAYEGSERIGRLLAEQVAHGPVYCLCGHRHQMLDVEVGGVRVLRSPVGYLEAFSGDLAELAKRIVGELVV